MFSSSSACKSASAYHISSESDHRRPNYDVSAISKMAATAPQIYFRFPFWWRTAIKNVKIYLHTKFWQCSLIRGRDITIFGFLKANGRHIEILLPVSTLSFPSSSACVQWFCVGLPNFIQIGLSAAELWRQNAFQDGGRQPCWICYEVVVDHSRSVVDCCCYVVTFLLDRIYSFGDSAIFRFSRFGLNLPIHGHF